MLRESEKKSIFPEEVNRVIEALNNSNRRKLIEIIIEKEKVSFSELLKLSNLKSSTLNFHLKELMKASLINNYYSKESEKKDYSFYKLTRFGLDFLKAIDIIK